MVAAAIAAVLAIVGAAAVAVAATRSDGGSGPGADAAPRSSCGQLTAAPGDVVNEASADVRKWSEPFRDAAATDPGITCAGPIQARDDTVFQQISWGGDDSVGILLAPTDPEAAVIVLNPLEYRRFRLSAWEMYIPGRRPGLPLRREAERPDGARIVSFVNGAIVQDDERDVAFAVTDSMYDAWIAEGGPDGTLGLPFSNRYERSEIGSTQDFANGRIVMDYVDGSVDIERYESTEHMTPDNLRGNIVRTPSSESWFVSDTGERRWLPTGDDQACVRNSRAAKIIDVPTAVVVDLPVGELLRCL